jgi:hypothetical protein
MMRITMGDMLGSLAQGSVAMKYALDKTKMASSDMVAAIRLMLERRGPPTRKVVMVDAIGLVGPARGASS